ncbi:ribbon-helix-helix domain-containing protein [Ancylobacter sp. Lp-2]|uniref:ribbon-helix-helix domain-containing protein n=1 Tax=Ancylobacter sp. Lp-2 TaxID=2881339 RepID=UPI001E3F591F|nr:ribbon-helix-helix domain-containing protein [Ancylobacter sp. Lp-2]MCB4771053.1 ribbon-helix-helix domain-containing protein [Ancylobacter sp. Lp-2]
MRVAKCVGLSLSPELVERIDLEVDRLKRDGQRVNRSKLVRSALCIFFDIQKNVATGCNNFDRATTAHPQDV